MGGMRKGKMRRKWRKLLAFQSILLGWFADFWERQGVEHIVEKEEESKSERARERQGGHQMNKKEKRL